MIVPIRALLVVACLAGVAVSQTVVWTYDNPQGYWTYEPAGDVDGDGVIDLIMGTPSETQFAVKVGAARVYSGADGGLLHEWFGSGHNESLGHLVAAAGDVDGDGFDDVYVGRSLGAASSEILLYSGATGLVLDSLAAPPGASTDELFVVGDADGDGSDDLCVVWYGACGDHQAQLAIVSGADHSVLASRCNEAVQFSFYGATPTGDLDGDGVTDLLVHRDNATGGEGVDAVWVLSGADLSVLFDIVHDGPLVSAFGSSLSGGHDVDGDGVPDFVIGARQDDHGGEWMGAVYVYSGADAALLHVLDGNVFYEQFGWVVCLPGDLDGDGLADVVVDVEAYEVDGQVQTGLVAFRSSDWSVLFTSEQGLPENVAPPLVPAGDVNQDGAPELLSYGSPPWAPGAEVWLISGTRLVVPSVGGGLAGIQGLPRLTVEGSLHNETPLTVSAKHFQPFVGAWVVVGYSAIWQSFKGGTLVPSPDGLVGGLPTDAEGSLSFTVQMPITLPPGFEIFVQLWAPDVVGPAGFAATDAARLAID